MLKEFYVDAILAKGLLPFVQEQFPNGYRFQQDNDPKQDKSWNYDSLFLLIFNRSPCHEIHQGIIKNWRTLEESPDLNPTEMLWYEL